VKTARSLAFGFEISGRFPCCCSCVEEAFGEMLNLWRFTFAGNRKALPWDTDCALCGGELGSEIAIDAARRIANVFEAAS
jgi:hypothetical protein